MLKDVLGVCNLGIANPWSSAVALATMGPIPFQSADVEVNFQKGRAQISIDGYNFSDCTPTRCVSTLWSLRLTTLPNQAPRELLTSLKAALKQKPSLSTTPCLWAGETPANCEAPPLCILREQGSTTALLAPFPAVKSKWRSLSPADRAALWKLLS